MKSFTPKAETLPKCTPKSQHEHRTTSKVKRATTPIAKTAGNASSNFEEFKNAIKARKRKERQESVTSLQQERKVIRSNSEERPLKNAENASGGMRRVSSSGDFSKSTPDERLKSPVRKYEPNQKTLAYDDHEHESRRLYERFARPYHLKSRKYSSKRFKIRYSSTKVKFKTEQEEYSKKTVIAVSDQIATQETRDSLPTRLDDIPPSVRDKSPESPARTPITPTLDLDFATLHEQISCSEPLLSLSNHQLNEDTETMPAQFVASSRMLSSPRNSIIATRRIYLDPDASQNVAIMKMSPTPVEERIQRLNKQINGCKRKILICESDFETKTGNKPTQFDKMSDDIMRKLYVDLSKLKKEQKYLMELAGGGNTVAKRPKQIELPEVIKEIEESLSSIDNVNCPLENMSNEKIIEEKIATQKALLYLESVYGRPQTRAERDLVRPFYDRYRNLKRMVAKISLLSNNNSELATIDENEAMHFVTPASSSNDTESETTETPTTVYPLEKFEEKKLHSLSKSELMQEIKVVASEKKELKLKIKEIEVGKQSKICKAPTKEEKKPFEELYASYKKVKGRLRLLEALIRKL